MGSKQTTFIEINGRRYNATTGELLGDSVQGQAEGQPIRDVVRVHSPSTALAKPKSPTLIQPTVVVPKIMDVKRVSGQSAKHRKPQTATTLMRSAVHKPAPGLKRHVKAQTRTDVLVKAPNVSVVPKWSFHEIDPRRLQRAKHVARSKLIQKFSLPNTSFSFAATTTTILPGAYKPVAQTTPVIPAHTPGQQRSMDIFQRALKHANAHEQPPVDPKKLAKTDKRQAKQHAKATKKVARRSSGARHHVLSIVTTSLAVVLLTGFIAYQNKTNLTMRYADAKAGFHATLPGYKPAGFALGNIRYGAGFVAANYHNDISNRDFTVSQHSSNWNSETLFDNYVAANDKTYQTLEDGGRTIYVYGNNNASWVNNGIWYQLNSNGSLSTSDILNVAASM